jgi:hypothetical protein
MGFTFETHGAITYLVYRIEHGETADATSLGMLINNKIAGLAPLYYTQADSDVFLRYAVTSKISVKDFFAGEVNRRKLAGVFSGIASSAAAAEEYLIDSSMFVLEPEYIFMDVTTLRISLVCLPVADRAERSPELRELFKALMVNARYDTRESCEYVAGIINYLNEDAPFTLSGLGGVVRGFERYDAGDTGAAPKARGPEGENQERGGESHAAYAAPGTRDTAPAGRVYAPAPTERAGDAPGKGSRPAERRASLVERGGARSTVTDPEDTNETVSISLPYLLTHYSRKNKLLYDGGRKRGGNKRYVSAPEERAGFAIPGEAPPPIGGSDGAADTTPQADERAARRERKRGGRRGKRGAHQDADGQNDVISPRPPPHTARRGFGDTTVLVGGTTGETEVLGETDVAGAAAVMEKGAPHLIRVRNDERIVIDKPLFRIGKEPDFADYCIDGNAAISRSHAYIVTRGGQCFLTDTNSANHTYLGDEMITSGRGYALAHGARFRLANEEFEFRLY